MKTRIFALAIAVMALSQSCVPKKQLIAAQNDAAALRTDSANLANQAADLQTRIANMKSNIEALNGKVSDLSSKNSALGSQTNEQKNQLNLSKDELARQSQRLQQLEQLLNQQREQTKQLKAKMSEALNSFNSNELTVTQKNGKVYVSLSEGLLFPSGSAVVNPRGVDALAKLAAVLNLNPDISVNIEGHTDSIPMRGKYMDNWALSTERANSIVRILTNNYKVDPVRVEASGHSKYDPVDVNFTAEGRAKNRRTEIILSPKLDEMYKLLEQ
ncbi:OmpA family protein [Parasediminibacterium sp. JCM 36343]|uniref:OmpA family protein n=1 Tax=Parasediminibacterium sp. JCM 36343 TaxID=3374279 RepID=UPI003977F9A5